MKVIKCEGFASGQWSDVEGQWLKWYDPEAFQGRGDVVWTSRRDEAQRFDTVAKAFQCWAQVPGAKPVREDGKPNKPLTAFSITIEEY